MIRKIDFIIIGWTLFFAAVGHPADRWSSVPLNHSVYDFIDRMQTRGVVEPRGEIRPWSRDQVVTIISSLLDSLRQYPDLLSESEIARLHEFRLDFSDELPEHDRIETAPRSIAFRPDRIKGWLHQRHLLHYQYDGNDFYANLFFREKMTFHSFNQNYDNESIFQHSGGGILRGNLGSHLGFYVHAANYREDGSRDYTMKESADHYGFVSSFGTYATYDRTDAHLAVNLPWLRVKYGKELITWGPGFSGKLSLSTNADSYDHLALTSQIGVVTLAHLTGFLNSRLTEEFEDSEGHRWRETVPKYLAAHRLEVKLRRNLLIGAHEMVVYGHRGLEAAYLNPFNFYRSAEHNLDDKDNAMMQFDLNWFPAENWNIHATWFVDDLYLARFFDHVFNNKFGTQVGLAYCGFRDIDLKLEYTRVDQWVYSHYLTVNTHSHNDRELGHWIGPDSDLIFIGATWYPRQAWRLDLTLERIRAGDVSDFHIPYSERTTDAKRFLEGIVEREVRVKLGVNYTPLEDMKIGLQVGLNDIRNKNNVAADDFRLIETIFQFSVVY